jgi:hypothetical protein
MKCVHFAQWYTAERKPCEWFSSQRCTQRCMNCGVLLPLGPAKDDGEHANAIEAEIRAAEIACLVDVSHSTTAHEFAGWCEQQGDHHAIDPTTTSVRQWWAGWLGRQIYEDSL